MAAAAPATSKKHAIQQARPQEQAKHTVKKTGGSVDPALVAEGKKLSEAYLRARNEYVVWAGDPEESAKLYLAQWCLAIYKQHGEWSGNGGTALDGGRLASFFGGRAREDRERREKVEKAAEELTAFLEKNDRALRKGAAGARAGVKLWNGLQESKAGRRFLAKQASESSFLHWMATAKAEEEAEPGEAPEQVKKAFEVNFAEGCCESMVCCFEGFEHKVEHAQGFKVMASMIHARLGVELVAHEGELHLLHYTGSVENVRKLSAGELWLKNAGSAVKLPGAVLARLLTGLTLANIYFKLKAAREKGDFCSAVGTVQGTMELAGHLPQLKQAVAAAHASTEELRTLSLVSKLAEEGHSVPLLKIFGASIAKSASEAGPIGALCGMCDFVIGAYQAGADLSDQQYAEAAAHTGAAVSGLLTMVGVAMLPVPGLDVIGLALVITGTVGSGVASFVAGLVKEDPMHEWARHSAFGRAPRGGVEEQVDELHEMMFRAVVKTCTVSVAEWKAIVEIELTNLYARSRVGVTALANGKRFVGVADVGAGTEACKVKREGKDGPITALELECTIPPGASEVAFDVGVAIDLHRAGKYDLKLRAQGSTRTPANRPDDGAPARSVHGPR